MARAQDFLLKASKSGRKDMRSKNIDPSESIIEERFVKFAKAKGCKAFKLAVLGRKGFPDRTVIGPNKLILFIEFKKAGAKLSAQQRAVKLIIEQFGFDYYVCDALGAAEAVLTESLLEQEFE